MGSGGYDPGIHSMRTAAAKAAGKSTFDYSDTTLKKPAAMRTVHPDLEPNGLKIRESRDSDEHPTAVAIATVFDVTGSMIGIPVVLQSKLPKLMSTLMMKGTVEHPQILSAGVGDATCDQFPLQIGQFESDNRIDEQLSNIILEGGGGGQRTESYELALYTIARHTSIDCYEKRGKKGYLFMIGDEMAYTHVKRSEVQRVIGDTLQADIPIADIIEEVQKQYEVFFIIPTDASHGKEPEIKQYWQGLLGQNVIMLDDAEAVCESIALLIGSCEGLDVNDAASALVAVGADESHVNTGIKAVANYKPSVSVATVDGAGVAVDGAASVGRL